MLNRFGWIVALLSLAAGGCAGRTMLEGIDSDAAAQAGAGPATGGAPGGGGSSGAPGTGGSPDSLVVVPASAIIPSRQMIELNAYLRNGAEYLDVTPMASWSVDDPAVATLAPVAAGTARVMATAGMGRVTVRAQYMGALASSLLTITPSGITDIRITPAQVTLEVGKTQQLQAVVNYRDGQRMDVTQLGQWSNMDEKVARVSNGATMRGLVQAAAPGFTIIAIRFAGTMVGTGVTVQTTMATTLSKLAITPANTTATVGSMPLQLTLTGSYADGTTRNLTTMATWRVDKMTTATVGGSDGRVRCLMNGPVIISASVMGQATSTTVTCGDKTIVAVRLTPGSTPIAPVPVGTALQFYLTAFYADGTQRDVSPFAEWSIEPREVATIVPTGSQRGQVTTIAVGTATVTAKYGGFTAEATLPVR